MEASMVVWTASAASWQPKELQAAIPTSVASMQVLQLELQSAHLRALRSTRGCLLSVCFVRPGVLQPKEVFTIELSKITGGSPVVPNSFEKTDERRSSSFLLWVHGRSGARGCMLSVALLRPGILEIHRTPFTYIYIYESSLFHLYLL